MDNPDSSGNERMGATVESPVTEEESGQKLLRFLERRLQLPASLLHRWIRTGQIRINGARCKPFDRVQIGDIVRLPPFARSMAEEAKEPERRDRTAEARSSGEVEIVENWNDILVINKPAGLPVQMGSGHEDSVNIRLEQLHGNDFYKPSAAHRLDRDTSGLLLAGATFEAQKALQENFHQGNIHKEYLAWVNGNWKKSGLTLLRNFLRKEKIDGRTRMHVLQANAPYAREALSIVRPLETGKDRSLLQVRILTGVTHQIRAQLASFGFPVLGDGKYGKAERETGLRLHAFRIILPSGHAFFLNPPWEGSFEVKELPGPIMPGINSINAIVENPELSAW